MEKEEIQNNTSTDQNEDTIKENEKPEENLAEENKQETDQEPKEEVKELTPEEKIAELEDKVTRTFAEMENQRRRFEKEKEDAFEYGGYSFAKEALNLIDNLDRSKHVLESDDKLKGTEALNKTLEHLDIIKKDLNKHLDIYDIQTYFPILSLFFDFYNDSNKHFILKSNFLINKIKNNIEFIKEDSYIKHFYECEILDLIQNIHMIKIYL